MMLKLNAARYRSLLLLLSAVGHAAAGEHTVSMPLLYVGVEDRAAHNLRYQVRAPGLAAQFTEYGAMLSAGANQVQMEFVGGSRSSSIEPFDLVTASVNFLIGDDPSKWVAGLSGYRGIRYREVYPGIDAVFSSAGRRLKSDFVVAPNADPKRIRLRYQGAQVEIRSDGSLALQTESGEIIEAPPEVYQLAASGVREPVGAAYRLFPDGTLGFHLGQYDQSRTLWIDPEMAFGTYLGGAYGDGAHAIAVDAANNVYVTGWTESPNFPTAAAFQTDRPGVDAFLAKLNPAGSGLVYATYIGGSGDDRGFAIKIDATGNAVVAGWTTSTNFPTTQAVQPSSGGGKDAFIARFNAAGSAVLFSTYLGGAGVDVAYSLAIGPGNSIYVGGETASPNFPVLLPFQLARGGQDGFVTKLAPAGNLLYSTYLGGQYADKVAAIAVDAAGAVHATGYTDSPNFPVLSPLQASLAGGQDAFVAKLNPTGSSLGFSTYLGGSRGSPGLPEGGNAITVDAAGNVYVAGVTSSTDFRIAAAFQPQHNGGGSDAFVAKIAASGLLTYSSYLGGGSFDQAAAVALGLGGSLHVAGYTSSFDFPSVSPLSTYRGSYDSFIASVNSAGTSLAFSTPFGGSAADSAAGLAVDASGRLYAAGSTMSLNLPVLGPAQASNAGTSDAWIAKFEPALEPAAPVALSVNPNAGSGGQQTFTFTFSDANGHSDLASVRVLIHTHIQALSSCYVYYTRADNRLYLHSDDATALLGPILPGTPGTVQNSRCSIDGAGSSVTFSGNQLTLSMATSFAPGVAGNLNLYGYATDQGGLNSGWYTLGSWSLGNNPPAPVSASPSSGSGSAQNFGFQFSDPDGYLDLASVRVLIHSQIQGASSCYVYYTRADNKLYLHSDSAAALLGPITPGAAGTVENSQCAVNGQASSVSPAGNSLTLNLSLSFKPGFAGLRSLYGYATDQSGVSAGWITLGSWTVSGGNTPPAPVSANPSSGSGMSQPFSFVFSDANGYADIASARILIHAQIQAQSSCYLYYTRSDNKLYLHSDSGAALVGPISPGTAGTLQNSQCAVDGAASSVSGTGPSLALNLAITFKPGFTGTHNLFGFVTDQAGLSAGWTLLGSWTAAASQSTPPAPLSANPASGAGSAQTFSFVFSDANGYTDLASVRVLIHSQIQGANACYVYYTAADNRLYLHSDNALALLPPVSPGAAGTTENSQCAINAATSSVSGAGNTLTLNLAISFKAGLTGTRNLFGYATDQSGMSGGWNLLGSWVVP
jgi:hypothetical protein